MLIVLFGLYIRAASIQVTPGSKAEQLGVLTGDLIVATSATAGNIVLCYSNRYCINVVSHHSILLKITFFLIVLHHWIILLYVA